MSQIVVQTAIPEPALMKPLDGRYQVVEILAAPLWGRTYLAQDLRCPSQPECIIRHLKAIPTVADYAALMQPLFAMETAVLEQLGLHPQIPQLLACFADEQGFYVVQEFVPGPSLDDELRSHQPWPLERVADLLLHLLEPLAFVHHQHWRHGNLKPSNVICPSGAPPVLIDFDSTRQLQLSVMSTYGLVSPLADLRPSAYQAPEQLRGRPTEASDVFAVGVMGIQALTGYSPDHLNPDPERGDIQWQTAQWATQSPLGEGVVAILQQMVCPTAAQRYSAATALQALDRLLHVISVPAVAVPPAIAAPSQPRVAPAKPRFPRWAQPSWPVGLTVAATCVVAGGAWYLLNSVEWAERDATVLKQATRQYQQGDYDQALQLAQSIPADSTVYAQAQTAIAQWQRDWKAAAEKFQAMQTALEQGRWAAVVAQAQDVPAIPYWQQQTTALVQRARANAEADATRLLQAAYQQAQNYDFSGALVNLRQIAPGTSVYAIAQQKQTEYQEKNHIHATALLQNAYDQAILHNFGGALTELRQIPPDASSFATAQAKIVEYTNKQRVQADVWLQKAKQQAQADQLLAALTSLNKIPQGGPRDDQVQFQIATYTRRLERWAERLVQQADAQATAGDVAGALEKLERVPLGTSAYDQARARITQYTQHQQLPAADSSRSLLNPGGQLREVSPITSGM